MVENFEDIKAEVQSWRNHKRHRGERMPEELKAKIHGLRSELKEYKITKGLGLARNFFTSNGSGVNKNIKPKSQVSVKENFVKLMAPAPLRKPSAVLRLKSGVCLEIFE